MSNSSATAQPEVNKLIFPHLQSLMALEAMKFCNGNIMSLPVRFAMQIGIILMQVYVYWKVFLFQFFFFFFTECNSIIGKPAAKHSFLTFTPVP